MLSVALGGHNLVQRKMRDVHCNARKNCCGQTRFANDSKSEGIARNTLGERTETRRGLDLACRDPQWSP
jgi:hypothetical protein